MLIYRIKAINQDTPIPCTFGMNILFAVKSQGNMDNVLLSEEDQVALLHLLSLHNLRKCIVLLVGIAWQDIASHTVTELNKTTTIDPLPTCTTPEIRYTQKGSCTTCNSANSLLWISPLISTYTDSRPCNPGSALAW